MLNQDTKRKINSASLLIYRSIPLLKLKMALIIPTIETLALEIGVACPPLEQKTLSPRGYY